MSSHRNDTPYILRVLNASGEKAGGMSEVQARFECPRDAEHWRLDAALHEVTDYARDKRKQAAIRQICLMQDYLVRLVDIAEGRA